MSPATSWSRPEKMMAQPSKPSSGAQVRTIISRTAAGMGTDCFHLVALG